MRDLHAGILALALELAERPHVETGWLIVVLARLSGGRLWEEWSASRRVLAGPVTKRMRLVGVVGREVQTEPGEELPERLGRWVGEWAGKDLGGGRCEDTWSGIESLPAAASGPTRMSVQVTKVLLVRWLRGQGPVGVGDLVDQVGCSYPTAAAALARLGDAGLLRRSRNRSVELRAFPAAAWQELAVWEGRFRRALRYRDPIGREAPGGLLRRLERGRPAGVALGGVAAARWWDPALDLHGLPRLDVVVHAPGERANLGFVAHLDPGLVPVVEPNDPGVLAVRSLTRAQSLFEEQPGALAVADPVETVLDLHDLGLDAQAGALIRRLRPEAVFL